MATTNTTKTTKKTSKEEFQTKKMLDIVATNDFITAATDMLFFEGEDGRVTYCPHLKDFSIRYNVLKFMSNAKLPGDPKKAWDYVYGKGVAEYESVLENASPIFIETIVAAVNEAVEWRKCTILKQNKIDELFVRVKRVLEALEEKISGADLQSILGYLETNMPELGEQVKSIFSQSTEMPADEEQAPDKKA